MSVDPRETAAAWDAAIERYISIEAPIAAFNVALLTDLRGRWAEAIRPDTSMFKLLFTRPDETGYKFTERVHVSWHSEERVEMALIRDVPRKALDQPGGAAVVTGDFTKPANALPAVEALLYQLAEPDDM